MKKRISLVSVGLLVALLTFVFTAASASAHGHRTVGDDVFVVGFLGEPTYVNQPNAIDLTICKGDCQYAKNDEGNQIISNPVKDADKTLKVAVIMGSSAPLSLTLVPNDEVPGKYTANFTPTKEGSYTFHFTGTLEGKTIDESFVSGKDGFDDPASVPQYPAAQSSSTSSGTSSDVTALQNKVNDLQGSASAATTIGIVGIVVGILGLGLAAFALTRKPRATVGEAVATPVDSLRG